MELLQKHFDTALESPDGIKKLRELILTLAMQGKLVKQDTKDQPASELLGEIQAEKERLIKEGKIKKQKELSPIKPEEVPYEVPSGWEWVVFGEIASIERGGSPRPINLFLTEDPDGLNWIKIGDTDKGGKYITSTKEKIRPEGLIKTRMVYPGDFLLTNSMSYGRPYITQIKGCIHDGWLRIAPPNSLNKDYLYNLLSSGYISNVFSKAAAGAVVQNLNSEKVRELLIPLPPLAEQKRIVAKINELMALCDKLEAQRNARNDKRLAVHTAAINRLLTAAEKNDFDAAWQFITRHFDPLYSVKENVAELKKAILTLAMQGKLVKQDPKDQPASELLKEIQAEKERLIKEGKIKPEEVPYQVPDGWVTCRLGEIGFWKSGSTPSRSNSRFYGGSIPWVKSGEVKQGRVKTTEETITEEALQKCSLSLNKKGSVLVAMYGANIGEVGILDIDATTNQAVCACKTYSQFDEKYLLNLITSLKPYFISKGAGAAQPNISREKIIATPFLLPPLAEQKRIVAKIDELMALCNKLESQIDQATTKQTALFDAVLAKV